MIRSFVVVGGLLLAALAAESVVLWQLMTADDPLTAREILSLLGLHIFAAATAAESLSRRYSSHVSTNVALWNLGIGLSFCLPVYGLLLNAVLILVKPRLVAAQPSLAMSPVEYRKHQAEAERAAAQQEEVADTSVEAITDALKDQDKAKRLGAIEALRALGNKKAVSLLHQSLNNTLFEVRYHAVDALSVISKKHAEQISQATAEIQQEPSSDNYRRLGEIYFEYASLEMEESSIQHHLFQQAVEYWRQSLDPQEPTAPEVLLKIAVSLEQLHHWEEAQQTYQTILEDAPEYVEAWLGLARLNYRHAQFEELQEICRHLLSLPQRDPQLEEILTFWANAPIMTNVTT